MQQRLWESRPKGKSLFMGRVKALEAMYGEKKVAQWWYEAHAIKPKATKPQQEATKKEEG